jgi:hypothetical protein
VADRLIRITTALAVVAVATVAAVISYRHAYEPVTTHGEIGLTARLLPFTVDGLILAASMLILDASRHHQPVPPLARWCQGAGIAATIGANLAHGLGHGPIGALVSARPGPGRLLRTPHDPHPHWTTPKDDSHPCASREPGCADSGTRGTTRASWHATGGADGTGLAQHRTQPARHRPRPRHRPPQDQTHHRPPT